MWNTLILVKQDNIQGKAALKETKSHKRGHLKILVDEEIGCHTHLLLIIYISFLYSGLLNVWRHLEYCSDFT